MLDVDEGKVAEAHYQSDSEESVESRWAIRRSEASNDDGDEDSEVEAGKERYRRFHSGFDYEPDGLRRVLEYDCKRNYDEYYTDGLEKLGVEVEELDEELELDFEEEELSEGRSGEGEVQETVLVKNVKEKVESDDLVVPTYGSFYMHDDRFRGRRGSAGRHRKTLVEVDPRKSIDMQKWGHDKFEEMMLQESRTCKNPHKGHRKDQGEVLGYVKANQFRSHEKLGNQDQSGRIVRGRGPVRYRPLLNRNGQRPPVKYKQKHKSASIMGSASPLSHPINSSGRDILKTQRIDEQHGKSYRNLPISVLQNNKNSVSTGLFLQGMPDADSVSSDVIGCEEPFQLAAKYHFTDQPMQFSTPIRNILLPYIEKFTAHPGNANHAPHPVSGYQAVSISFLPSFSATGRFETLPSMSNGEVDLVGRESGVLLGDGRSSLYCGGIRGPLPAMQLGGYRHGSPGEPALGMIDTEYVAQTQYGLGNPEIMSNRACRDKPWNSNKPLDKSELVGDEIRSSQIKPQQKRQVSIVLVVQTQQSPATAAIN